MNAAEVASAEALIKLRREQGEFIPKPYPAMARDKSLVMTVGIRRRRRR